MKIPALVSLLFAFSLSAPAAESPRPTRTQTGQGATVRLLATSRVKTQTSPDGMRFLFLVTPTPVTSGAFTIKETRDFLLGGQSYQEKTQVELGKRFEPESAIDSAEGFFAKQPGLRRLAPEGLNGGDVLTVSIAGATLTQAGAGEVTVNVGYNKQVEPFTFAFAVPPAAANAKAKASSPSSPTPITGAPPEPADGRTRYVATQGIAFSPWTLDLKMTDKNVTGAIHQDRKGPGGMNANLIGPFEIFDGSVEANTISFKAKTPGGERIVIFTGEIAGDEIRFRRAVEVAAGADPGRDGILGATGATQFVAKRLAQP